MNKPLAPTPLTPGARSMDEEAAALQKEREEATKPPFLALAISGGNTLLIDVAGYTDMKILGGTRDDAAGECFDKTARVLGLGYPGGGPMDKMAQGGNDKAFVFPRAHVADHPLDMSFSGLKTAVLNAIHNASQKGEELDLHDLAASFAAAVSDSLIPRAMEADRMTGYHKIAVAGGVAANSRIRADLERFTAGRDEIDRKIIELVQENYTERQIADVVKISNVAVHKRIVKIRAALQNVGIA